MFRESQRWGGKVSAEFGRTGGDGTIGDLPERKNADKIVYTHSPVPEAAPATPAEELTDRARLNCVDKETAQRLGLQTIAEGVERRED